MNESMRFFLTYIRKIDNIFSDVIAELLDDTHIIINPTGITESLIDSFHTNSDNSILELGNVYRITKDNTSTILYLCLAYKRYGRTYKPKQFLLLNSRMNTLSTCLIDDDNVVSTLVSAIKTNI